MGERLFDVYCVVDWSANATPKRGADSIWVGELIHGRAPTAVNLPTRRDAEHHLHDLLDRHSGRRVLLGVDFPLGYPSGFAEAAGLTGDVPWRATWQHLATHLTDDERNRNNRWEVAADLNERMGELRFWGCPPRRSGAHLTTRRPPGLAALTVRRTEAALRSHTGRPPFTVWQLLGAGSVGSQALTGIPVMQRLLDRDRVTVWPLCTGLTTDPCGGRADSVVLAEVWPSTVSPAEVLPKDRGQVVALASHFAQLDATGELAAAFQPTVPADAVHPVLAEEGWVLGAPSRLPQEAGSPLES